MRHVALAWLFALGCGPSMHHAATTPPNVEDIEVEDDDTADDGGDDPAQRDFPMRVEDVPARVRLAAAAALKGADSIAFVHTSAGQYEATATIDGEEQDVTISPSGAIIDLEEADEIDLTEEDDDAPATATAPPVDHGDDDDDQGYDRNDRDDDDDEESVD